MNVAQQWYQNNTEIAFLVYGLSLVVMGVAILSIPKDKNNFHIGKILWLLSAFALIHGCANFINMHAAFKGQGEISHWMAEALTYVSYFFLFEFGRRLVGLSGKIFKWYVLPIIAVIIALFGALSGVFWTTVNVLVGYLVRFPAGIMAAAGLILYHNSQKEILSPLKARKYFFWAGISFFIWAFFCGIIREKADFFPASILNAETFYQTIKVPVYFFRTAFALIFTIAICGILKIFNREMEERLKDEINLRDRITDAIEEGMLLIGRDFRVLWQNKKQQDLYGEIIGDYCYHATHKLDGPCHLPDDICPIGDVLKTGRPSSAVHTHLDKAGNKIFAEVTVYPVKNSSGEIAEFIHMTKDITERRRMDEALGRSYQTQAVINSILHVSLGNISLEEMLERILDKVIAIPWLLIEARGAIFMVEEEPGVLIMKAGRGVGKLKTDNCKRVPFGRCLCGRAALSGKIEFAAHVDERHENSFQDIGPHGHYCVPITASGKTLGVINFYLKEGHLRDQKEEESLLTIAGVLAGIIQRKRAEEDLRRAYEKLNQIQMKLIQTEKMVAVGQLAGGVAHEINNPLTGVLNNVQLIRMLAEGEKDFSLNDFKELLDIIEESGLRCKRITQSLLDFSHVSKGTFQSLSLNSVIEKVIVLIEHEMSLENIVIEKQLQPGIPQIMGDPQLLQQVVFNFISNARWAVKKKNAKRGGLITIKSVYNPEINHVHFYLSDNGIGIPKGNVEKIFDPFFTTKPVGEGTGLGLSIAYSVIKEHGGSIEVESEENKGATFKISLPAVSDKTNGR